MPSLFCPRLRLAVAAAAAAALGSTATAPVAPHLKVMTYYTHPKPAELEVMHGWVTVVSEQGTAAGAVATMANWSLPSLMGPLPWNPPTQAALSSPDALLMYANAKNRSVRERGYLQPDWRGALARWVAPLRPLFANRTAQGVFTGDEMGCGASKVNPANYSAILRELRALVGPGPLLYANDCVHSAGSSLHPKNDYKPGCCVPYPTPARPSCRCGRVDLKVVPPELDLVSMDCCLPQTSPGCCFPTGLK